MIKTTASVSSTTKVKPVKPWQADKPMKDDKPFKVTGVHAHKDRVAPAKTTLAF